MTREELTQLFDTHLKRDFSEYEWSVHNKKSYESFEHELLNSDEYKNSSIIDDRFKIGVLLTGHIRNNDILDGILKYFKKLDYDVFIHTWDNVGKKGDETNLDDLLDIDLINYEISKIPNVKSVLIENNKDVITKMKPIKGYFNYSSPEVFIKSQLYSINKTFSLLENYSKENDVKYDVIFKFRFDSKIDSFTMRDELILDIIENEIIFVPNEDNNHVHLDYGTSCHACDTMYYKHGLKKVHIFPHTTIICDLFAYGNYNAMRDYCDAYNHYDEINKSFTEGNLKSLKTNNENIILEDGNYVLQGYEGHIDSFYYFNCSYPERILQVHLKNYMLVQSKKVKLSLVR
jgi:hypothetical protein